MRRKVPSKTEKRKQRKPLPVKRGQTFKLGKGTYATIVRADHKRKGNVIVRVRSSFVKKFTSKQKEKIAEVYGKISKLDNRLRAGKTLTLNESAELYNLLRVSASMQPAGQKKLVKIMSMPVAQLPKKEVNKPKHQVVPQVQRKKSRRASIVKQVKKKTRNPQRRAKILTRKGIRPRRSDNLSEKY